MKVSVCLQLPILVGEATLLATTGMFVLAFALLFAAGFKTESKPSFAEMLGVVIPVLLLPAAIARWWMLPKLALIHSLREARSVSNAFSVSCPFALGVGIVAGGAFGGGWLGYVLPSRFFTLLGAFFGTSLLAAFLNAVVCALALRVTRLAMSVEQAD